MSFSMSRCTKSGRMVLDAKPGDENAEVVRVRLVRLLSIRLSNHCLYDKPNSAVRRRGCPIF